jgi:ABC-type sugar transport system permease subunit
MKALEILSSQALDGGMAEPEIFITLVHGTWPRGWFPKLSRLLGSSCCWFERGSTFVDSLEKSLQIFQLLSKTQICAFIWSGNNSFLERNKAAAELASLLSAQKNKFPKSRQLIVAHSHGGNVALRALYYLPADFAAVNIATIATPFVEARVPFRKSKEAQLASITRRLRARTRRPWARKLAAAFHNSLKRKQRTRRLRSASSLSHLTRRLQHRLLVIRAIDDEAALVLAAGAIGTRLSAAVSRLILVSSGWTLLLLIFSFPVIVAMSLILPVVSDRLFNVLALSLVILFIAPWIIPLLAVGAKSFRTVYGRELWSGIDCEINSQSVPDVAGTHTRVITLPQWQYRGRRRHMLYDAPECAGLIMNWFVVERL